jgi:hypothetical protein
MRLAPLFGLLLVPAAALIGCASSTDDTGSSEGADSTATCLPTLECAAPPLKAQTHLWRHWIETPLNTTTDATTGLPSIPNHRGRDQYVNPGAPQWVIGHFAYGITQKFLIDEDVDIYAQRDCASQWELLGTATTTGRGAAHASEEGVDDDGGRIFFQIPKDKEFAPGRHRIRMVVKGDGSMADLFIDVIPPNTPIFVSDVDGTLTSSENVEFEDLLIGVLPDTHPNAVEDYRTLVNKGYRVMYLTARPEPLVNRTREFLDARGFPPGIIHTTNWELGTTLGDDAGTFKTKELAELKAKGLTPKFGFGNRATDSQAYATSIADPNDRFFYQITEPFTGHKINDYGELLSQFQNTAPVCTK